VSHPGFARTALVIDDYAGFRTKSDFERVFGPWWDNGS
jgi:hypothetical protein